MADALNPDRPAIESRLPDECLQNVVDHLDLLNAKTASLLNSHWNAMAKKRLFTQINLSAPPNVPQHTNQGYIPSHYLTTLAKKLVNFMHALQTSTFANFRAVSVSFKYDDNTKLLSENYKWWASILRLTTSLRYVKVEISLSVEAAEEKEYAPKDAILLALLEVIAECPSKPQLSSLTFTNPGEITRKDWIGRLAVLRDSLYVEKGRSVSKLIVPYIRAPTRKEVEDLFSSISALQPTSCNIPGIESLPPYLFDIPTYGTKKLDYRITGQDKEDQESVLDQTGRILKIFPGVTHLDVEDDSQETLCQPLSSFSMNSLSTFEYDGQHSLLVLEQLKAPSLRSISLVMRNLDAGSLHALLIHAVFPSLQKISFGGEYDIAALSPEWFDSYRALVNLAEQRNFEIELTCHLESEALHPVGNASLLKQLGSNLSSTSMAFQKEWSGSLELYRAEASHFPKLTNLHITVKPLSNGSTVLPGFSWFVAWLAVLDAPQLEALDLTFEQCVGVDMLLAVGAVVGRRDRFPLLERVGMDICMNGGEGLDWEEGYSDYMTEMKTKFVKLCGPDVSATVDYDYGM